MAAPTNMEGEMFYHTTLLSRINTEIQSSKVMTWSYYRTWPRRQCSSDSADSRPFFYLFATVRFSRVSSRPQNGRGMRQNSSTRLVLDLKKQGSKVSSLKWMRKRPKFRRIPCLVLEKAGEKFLASSHSRPQKNSTKGLVLDLVLARWPPIQF